MQRNPSPTTHESEADMYFRGKSGGDDEEEQAPKRIRPNFKNWTPPHWDVEMERDLERKRDTLAAREAGEWVLDDGSLDELGTEGPEGVEHVKSGKEWVRIRRMTDEDGNERVQRVRVTRIFETWTLMMLTSQVKQQMKWVIYFHYSIVCTSTLVA